MTARRRSGGTAGRDDDDENEELEIEIQVLAYIYMIASLVPVRVYARY